METETMHPKSRENRLRRWAGRIGYRIEHSRARSIQSNNFGDFRLLDIGTNTVVCGARYDATIDEVEECLAARQAELDRQARAA
jgi:hypothetical protein